MKILAILLNFFIPGVGSFVIGKIGSGIAQILIYGLGMLFCFTLVGAVIGLPMMLAAWIWGLVTAMGFRDLPIQVTVVHQNGASTASD